MPVLIERARAKLNLFLHVTGKRANGFHELATYVVFTDLADVLSFQESDLLTLSVTGEFAGDCAATAGDKENLVLRAARALQAFAGTTRGAHITLEKNIPVGAGLGGGSADAAAALRALDAFWGLGLGTQALCDLGFTLGADVPMCVQNRPLFATGIGETMQLGARGGPELWLVLVHPRQPLLTAHVFALLTDEEITRRCFAPPNLDFKTLEETSNDLQRAAIAVSPLVGEVLLAMETQLPEPRLVRMTGSGACCFALFAAQDEAQRYANALQREYPKWWMTVTRAES